ncbi:ParB N-terminal domain-containing protein [Burkholderia sp. 22PA0106]|uniref:ParB N-terminal domain-containing protein n=1 Tax=Burkholderia sp. 22PA0106 TaxID=3237371 RepID=UPI0039C19D37
MSEHMDAIFSHLERSDKIMLISIDRLRVLNPRTRNQYFFSQLVENIASVGLKRPITVARGGIDGDGQWHEVLCGQGRLEALKALGETMIPCSVVEASEVDRYLITLTENIARRRHSTTELLSALQVLRSKDTLLLRSQKRLISMIRMSLVSYTFSTTVSSGSFRQ